MPLLSMELERLDKLYIIGYGFGDYHINMRLQKAMYTNDKLMVVIVNPSIEKQELFKPFDYDLRVRYTNVRTPEWMNYEITQNWNKELKTRLDMLNKYLRQVILDEISNIFKR